MKLRKFIDEKYMALASHPIFLLTRPGGDVGSLYHSFFCLDRNLDGDRFGSKSKINVVSRIPDARRNIEDIEGGIKTFVADAFDCLFYTPKDTAFGFFVLTTSDGSRFYAMWRGCGAQMFVAVTRLPLISFTRQIFNILENESKDSSLLPLVLLSLCEMPVVPCSNIEYELRFPHGSQATLKFSEIDKPYDSDLSSIPLSIFSPQMIVDSWEALIMERKVLVISSDRNVVPICTEFINSLTSPLPLVCTYVPLLPSELINAIEAPFPYLLGAHKDEVTSEIDLSDTVVVDLDLRQVIIPSGHAELQTPQFTFDGDLSFPEYQGAPLLFKQNLTSRVNTIIMESLSNKLRHVYPTINGESIR